MTSRTLPGGIWALGLVSLLMDVSSEMIHSLLPVFLVVTLGSGPLALGLIEGIGESTASLVKLLSGRASDRTGRRKPLAVAGYAVSALSKAGFALAASPAWVLGARFADRVGKGVRAAPRDALVSDLTPEGRRGAAFGLRQALDSAGAVGGPLAAAGLVVALGGDIRRVFWVALLPAAAAVAVLAWAVPEPPTRPELARPGPGGGRARDLGVGFWAAVAIGVVLSLARFSEAFLLLRARGVGAAVAVVPLVLAVMNLAYAVSAYPLGALSDRMGRRGVLALGCGALAAAHLLLAGSQGLASVLAGAVLWGLHLGATQGLLAALVADAVPRALQGTGYGAFHALTGLGALAASLLAGVLWEVRGPEVAFGVGAALALVALAGVLARGPTGVRAAPEARP